MGMMTKPQTVEEALEAAAREATKDVFVKPFRPAIPATLDALLQVNSGIERTLGWVIEGWLIDDLVPHFGRAKIGKSTGTAGQIACIASIDTVTGKRAHHWCGHRVNRHGIVLYYSGEETKDEIAARMERTFRKMGYRGADLDAVMRRVVPICPKSWSPEQYAGLNPFICAKMPVAGVGIRHEQYQSTATLEWIYDLVDNHNADVDARDGADDEKIIGVVFDSMTSVAGFSSTDEEGIPNLLFDLGRSAQRRRLFVILVAHSPQSAKVDPLDPDRNAIDRLKGNGAWSAICRLMVEWRLPGDRTKADGWFEAKTLVDKDIISINDEVVVCVVADGNVGFSKQKMWFKRDGEGGHTDLSRFMTEEPRGFNAEKWKARKDTAEAQGVAAAAAGLIDVDRAPAVEAVLAMINEAMTANEAVARENGEKLAKVPNGTQIMKIHKEWLKSRERLERWPVLSRDPKNGGISSHSGGDHSIRDFINRLIASKKIADVVGGVVPLDRVSNGYRVKHELVEDKQVAAPPLDLEPVFEAVCAVVEQLDADFEHAGGDKAHEVAVNAKNIQSALRSSRFMKAHPVLRAAFEDGRLVHNGPANKAPLPQSPEWVCEQLVSPARGRLVRLANNTYARPVVKQEKAA
jgi:hypothetical protein